MKLLAPVYSLKQLSLKCKRPVWGGSRSRNDPGLLMLLLLSHGHDLLLLLGQTLHLRLQEAQRRVQPLNGAGVIRKVSFPRSHT